MNVASVRFPECSSILDKSYDQPKPSQSLDTSSISQREKASLGEPLPIRPSTTQPEAPDTLIEDAGLTDSRIIRPLGDALSSPFPRCSLDRSFELQHPQDEGYVTDQGLEDYHEDRSDWMEAPQLQCKRTSFLDLPPEILRTILDEIFGSVSPVSSSSLVGKSALRSINTLMRHPRRKALSDIALVCPSLRELIQERIYRQVKIKGTEQGLRECREWFIYHPHLTKYVRHVEYWIPVWGNKTLMPPLPSSLLPTENYDVFGNPTMLLRAPSDRLDDTASTSYTFERATQNATLSSIFDQVHMLFPEARILTLEGGHCKKPPMIQHFLPSEVRHFSTLRNIRTLVMRGTWNIMRQFEHWRNIQEALPNLQEWHCAYAKHKPESYPMISKILLTLPPTMLHVNLSLEGFYSKPDTSSVFTNTAPAPHLCDLLGRVAPRLESLTYSGRICACFFSSARRSLQNTASSAEPRLRSLDLVVKSCCPPIYSLSDSPDSDCSRVDDFPLSSTTSSSLPADPSSLSHSTLTLLSSSNHSNPGLDLTGIANPPFIRAFELLTLNAVRALSPLPLLSCIRIRFIDLDSTCPLLNPYFQLYKGRCSGIWNEEILDALGRVRRPGLEYEELGDGIAVQWGKGGNGSTGGGGSSFSGVSGDNNGGVIVGAVYPRVRPKAIHSGAYRILASTR